MSKLTRFLWGGAIGVAVAACAFVGIYFRPFWRSDWGMPTFIFILWAALSLALGWGGKGKPYSPLFGLVAGSAIVFYLVMCFLIIRVTGINAYVGMVPFFLLVWLSMKSKIVENRMRELNADPGE